jgi:hypothetical protein
MFARGRVFLETLKIWHPFNLALLACITTGLIAASRIHMDGVRLHLLATLAALCTFGELFLFSRTWITFSAPPNGQGLYENTEWMMRLKKETGPGTILCYDRSEFDYLQLNTPSVYGLRFAEGYETVTPKRINPYADDLFDPARCASAGISHLLVAPGKDPGEVPGWEKTITSKKFVLYRNPQFTGICHAGLLNGETLPLVPRFQSPNRREIPLPENTKTVTLLESFNPGWKYSTDGESWLPVLESPLHGIRVELENPTITESARLLLQYRPVYQPYYRGIMTTTALGLLGFSIYRRQKQRQYLKRKPCAQAPPPLALLAFVQGIFRDARGRDVHAP